MSNLLPTTLRRLKRIPQNQSVWEGDRRPLVGMAEELDPDTFEGNGDCIIWVDGTEGVVRAMDVVSPEMGVEAVARTLLRAMENPHNPARQSRPQKIVVRDREIQFFLRGALQNLDITIEYVSELPIIDELFRGFEQMNQTRPPKLPPQYAQQLEQVAYDIWNIAPWDFFADHQIVSIQLNQWDVTTLYVSIMGMLGREYGLLFYRSLESLKRFRATVLTERSVEQLEHAFLSQDCWFVNFETDDEDFDPEEEDLEDLPLSDIYPLFGSVHPYEGMRPFLGEEEAIAVYVALKALATFINSKQKELNTDRDEFPALEKRCRISLPQNGQGKQTVSVEVATLPDLALELLEMATLPDPTDPNSMAMPIHDDLVPDESLVSLGALPWEQVKEIRNHGKKYYQSLGAMELGDELPIVIVQTSRPKAKVMIEKIQACGGLQAICFNPGEDPFSEETYDLGLLQSGNSDLYLFGEFVADDSIHLKARKKWEQRIKQTQGYCGLIVAMGLKGSARGKPRLQDMMALFEAKALAPSDLGMGILQLIPQFGFELDF